MTQQDSNLELIENSNSLITRALQIMIVIIGLGLVSMISSMLVAESLSGDAENINRAGKLRMLAVKVSRAAQTDEVSYSPEKNAQFKSSQSEFEVAFTHLFDGGLTDELDDPEIQLLYQQVAEFWNEIKIQKHRADIETFDRFVGMIDLLVLQIQRESEDKISLLRAIQGISLLSVIIVAIVVLSRINRGIVLPLRQLVVVAEAAGKGDFNLRSEYDENNELGLLSKTINKMSQELKLTHEEFEQRVEAKTSALSQSNHTLSMLYQTSKRLSNENFEQLEPEILIELESSLGFGRVSIELNPALNNALSIELSSVSVVEHNICFDQIRTPIQKGVKKYGCLIWNYNATRATKNWQINLLETIAEMLASARSYQQKRVAENRLVIIEERAVIARELHDSLAQSLSYLKIQVALLSKKLDKNLTKEQVNLTVEDIRLGLNRAYFQLRELLTTFRLQLKDPSLKNALSGTVIEFSSKSNHPIVLEYDLNNKSFTANQEIHVLQIVREALSNVSRHAKASHAKVTVKSLGSDFIVSISDNGVGMSENSQREGHFGLGIMQERAKSLHASIDIKSSLGDGTEIFVVFAI